jgi:hypothetical protein
MCYLSTLIGIRHTYRRSRIANTNHLKRLNDLSAQGVLVGLSQLTALTVLPKQSSQVVHVIWAWTTCSSPMEGSLIVVTSSQSVVDIVPTHCTKIKHINIKRPKHKTQKKTGGSDLPFLVRTFVDTAFASLSIILGRCGAISSQQNPFASLRREATWLTGQPHFHEC